MSRRCEPNLHRNNAAELLLYVALLPAYWVALLARRLRIVARARSRPARR